MGSPRAELPAVLDFGRDQAPTPTRKATLKQRASVLFQNSFHSSGLCQASTATGREQFPQQSEIRLQFVVRRLELGILIPRLDHLAVRPGPRFSLHRRHPFLRIMAGDHDAFLRACT